MKKQNIQSFLSGVLVTLLCVALIGSAAATAGRRTLAADYSDIKIMLDGEQLSPRDAIGAPVEPFAVNGTTYLPVRAVGEALGLTVGWDADTHTVVLTSPASTPASPDADWMDELSAEDRYEVTFAFLRAWIQEAQNDTTSSFPTYREERTRPGSSGGDMFSLSYIEERDEIALVLTTYYESVSYHSYVAFSGNDASGLVPVRFVAYSSASPTTPIFNGYSRIYAPTFCPESDYSFYLHSGNEELVPDYENLAKWMNLSSLNFMNYIFETYISQYGPYSLSDLGFDLDMLGL